VVNAWGVARLGNERSCRRFSPEPARVLHGARPGQRPLPLQPHPCRPARTNVYRGRHYCRPQPGTPVAERAAIRKSTPPSRRSLSSARGGLKRPILWQVATLRRSRPSMIIRVGEIAPTEREQGVTAAMSLWLGRLEGRDGRLILVQMLKRSPSASSRDEEISCWCASTQRVRRQRISVELAMG